MPLIKILNNQTVVILAQTFNPSIFNQYWLVSNNFVNNDELSNSIFTPTLVQFSVKNFNLNIIPERLQIISNNNNSFDSTIKNTLIPIVNKLQEVPYNACGINFNWIVEHSEKSISELSKELFWIGNSSLYDNFNVDDSRFGTYMSKNYLNARLKLDIKPITITNIIEKSQKELLQFSFNFHVDLSNEMKHSELISTLNSFDDFLNETKRIMDSL